MTCKSRGILASIFLLISIRAAAQPVINSFTPAKGPAGSTITISGSNFNPTPANNFIFFGPVRGGVVSGTTTSLVVNVPGGISNEPVSVFDVTTKLTGFANKPFGMTFNGSSTFTPDSFLPKKDFITGTNNNRITVADITLDQKPDILVANGLGLTFTVVTNNSTTANPAFTSVTFPVASNGNISDIVAADFDGDGRKDVIVTNHTADRLVIFRNETPGTGPVTFGPKSEITSDRPYVLIAADFDRDGKIDIAVANHTSRRISIHRNITTGAVITFAAPVDFDAGSQITGLGAADLDDDGKIDLVACNQQEIIISVFKNTTSGSSISFAAKVDHSTGGPPGSVAFGDLDDDGKIDIATANNQGGNVSVFRNVSSAGSINFAPKIELSSVGGPYSISIADLNGDGKPDIGVSNTVSSSVSIFGNTSTSGALSFAAKQDYATDHGPRSLIMTDFDLDGRLDIATGNWSSYQVSILMNNVTNTQTCEPVADVKISANSSIICSAVTPVFTASVTSQGTSPLFQWKINGSDTGPLSSSPTFSPAGLKVGDKVTAEVTLSNSCGYTYKAAGNTITMTDAPLGSPSITISASTTEFCAATEVTFSSVVTNAGSVPSYQWIRNGEAISGATSATYTSKLFLSGDRISCEVVRNEQCQTSAKALSNEVAVKVNPAITPEVTIQSDATVFYEGSSTTFTASVQNGGTSPAFDWQINGQSVSVNKATFTTKNLAEGDLVSCILTSNATCISSPTVLSNIITINITPVTTVKPPTAFTPNGDAINDTWEIPGITSFPGNTVEIFNQYGSRIFASRGYQTPWNGEYNGVALPVGVYYYVVKLDGSMVVSGNVMILR